MTTARKQLICLESTAYYHCVSRCVRRSYLCGEDELTGKSYEHRRAWVEEKIYQLADIYCVDICAYAVMSNHYHLVVYLDKEGADTLTKLRVVQRWGQNHRLPLLVERWLRGEVSNQAERESVEILIEEWRRRLYSLSWFMKELNFYIACRANQEDGCKGHFWEGRFKSQALMDEQALIAAMAYVDLNPVRAGIEEMPETSAHTSIKARVSALKRDQAFVSGLADFIGNKNNEQIKGLPFRLIDYLTLVDWSARQYREGKASLKESTPSILNRLNLTTKQWMLACTQLEKARASSIGCARSLAMQKRQTSRKRIHSFCLDG
ncbi:transposase [Vibrio sp. S4M6]|uniref:transposase n=1 Tax=Vibrio sinus TaxID=2946865 RepID=UPI00202A2169|nr:transposase [Vibrio sinus]MCL9780187.1 transposase [Vibrio sinus]